jgi:DNA-binding NarL/FixJ family response regulator
VVVVDPLPVVRAGLRLLIGGSDLEVIADVGTAREALDVVARRRHSKLVVLVGLGLGGPEDAAWLIRAVRERHPADAVVAVGANADAAAVSRMLFVGADGYIDKNVHPEEFLSAVRQAALGQVLAAMPSSLDAGEVAGTLDRRRALEVSLTEREREVLTVAAEGLTARQIAERLGVRERTVTTHLARIYGKLGVGNRFAAVRMAMRSGLVSAGVPE